MADSSMAAGPIPARPVDWPAALKDALIIAGVTLAMALPMIGFETTSSVMDRGWPLLNTRIPEVVAAVVAVFVGRLGLNLIRMGMAAPVALLAWAVFGLQLVNMLTGAVGVWNEALGWLLVLGAFVV